MHEQPARPLTPSEQRTVDTLERLLAAAADAQPAARCFAYMRLRSRGRTREVLLGSQTAIDQRVTVLDWQRAPLAEVFFSCDPGDDYEVEVDDRALAGTLIDRGLLGVDRGRLVEVQSPAARLARHGDAWQAHPAPATRPIAALPSDRRHADQALSRDALDATQRRAVELPVRRSLLILGDAGFGKTTVALHRLRWLKDRAADPSLGPSLGQSLGHEPGQPLDALVLVPTEGLRRLTARILDQMDLDEVRALTVDQWISAQARAVFPDLPARDSSDATAAVIRLKRHPALAQVLPAIAARRRDRATRRDLFHLFGDRALLEQVARASDGAITQRAVDEVIAHTVVQFSHTTEQAHAHVDADRLITIDGRAIDDGTPLGDADTMDAEDAPVMFELNRLRAGGDRTRAGRLQTYRHIVVDEAQELAPLELAVIGRALAPGGSLVVAGDAHQQVDDTACFAGWDATMAALAAADHERVVLRHSYRCPPAVERLARAVRDWPAATPAHLAEPGEPLPIAMSRHDSACHLTAAVIDQLRALLDADPQASVAVICRTRDAARRVERNLGRGVPTRLALDGAFGFEHGVDVTCVDEVKGLEFDCVIVPDADAASYPATPEASRALYVAVTRPLHHLWLCTTGTWTPLLGGLSTTLATALATAPAAAVPGDRAEHPPDRASAERPPASLNPRAPDARRA